MNNRHLNIVVFLCFSVVLAVYYVKSERTSDYLDLMEKSLSGLKKKLPPTARVWYYGLHTDTINGRENYPLARYTLAPVILDPPVNENNIGDSILLIFRNDADSSIKYLNEGTNIIWENRDSAYHYLLIQQLNEPK